MNKMLYNNNNKKLVNVVVVVVVRFIEMLMKITIGNCQLFFDLRLPAEQEKKPAKSRIKFWKKMREVKNWEKQKFHNQNNNKKLLKTGPISLFLLQ